MTTGVDGSPESWWALDAPGSPLGLITHLGSNESASSLCLELQVQGLAPQGCTVRPATEDETI